MKPKVTEPSYINEDFSFSSDDSEDAPAEVSTSTVRKKQLSKVREFRARDKETKEKEKEKRRKRDEMFKSQKEQKLKKFGKRALPDDILEAVSAKNTKLDKEVDEGINVKDDRLSGSDSNDEDVDDVTAHGDNDDFISLDSSKPKGALQVVTVEAPRKNKSSQENALAFRNNQLYHAVGLAPPRETANQRQNRMRKKQQLHGK